MSTIRDDEPDLPFAVLPAEKPPKLKRGIVQPRDGFMIKNVKAQTVTPIPYDIVKEGIQT